MFAVKVRSRLQGDKELRPVGVRTSVGHTEKASPRVLLDEVLILELAAIYALTTRSIAACEVAALQHKPSIRGGQLRTLKCEAVSDYVTKCEETIISYLMMRWNFDPLYFRGLPETFESPKSPALRRRKFSAVFGVISLKSSNSIRPACKIKREKGKN